VAPLQGDEVLMSCRLDAPKADNPKEFVTSWVFRTLDLKTGKVKNHGTEYRGLTDANKGPYFEMDGKLVLTRTFLENKGFVDAQVGGK